ncbi:hypothetical protein D9M69_704550 [compost metagenome]
MRALTEVWTGDRSPQEVLSSRDLRVEGAHHEAQSLWRWLGTSVFAETRRSARSTLVSDARPLA